MSVADISRFVNGNHGMEPKFYLIIALTLLYSVEGKWLAKDMSRGYIHREHCMDWCGELVMRHKSAILVFIAQFAKQRRK